MKEMFVIAYEELDDNYIPIPFSGVFITDAESVLKTAEKYAEYSTILSVKIHKAKISEENGQVVPGELVKEVK